METKREFVNIVGKAGNIETVVTYFPKSRGIVFLAHPHPLLGGSLSNKVIYCAEKAFNEAEYCSVKFNFRGVGNSSGFFDNGLGETQDLLAIYRFIREHPLFNDLFLAHDRKVVLVGYSFGSFVTAQAAQVIPTDYQILIAPAPNKWNYPQIQKNCYLIHGEMDEIVPLKSVFEWLRGSAHPVIVLPGIGHHFNRGLRQLKNCLSELIDLNGR